MQASKAAMAATQIISDNDNTDTHIRAYGHVNPMGNCASAGKKKVCKESSSSSTTIPRPSPSTRRFQEMAKQAISTSARSSSTGKDRGVPTMRTSSQSTASSSSTGKDHRFSPVPAAATTTTTASTTSNHGRSHHTALSGVLNHSHSHHTASIDVPNHGRSHHTASRGANTSTDPDSSRGVLNHSHLHHTASRGATINAKPMQSQLGETKLPCSLHKPTSTPLKPGANGGSTPRKTTDGFHGRSTSRKSNDTSTKMDPDYHIRAASPEHVARVTETSSKGRNPPFDTKGLASEQRAKELCKDCKASTLESVCFIANDGRITAAITGAASFRHFHSCNSPRCAANPNYHPSPSAPSKKVLVSKKRSPLSQVARTKSSTLSRLGDHSSICSSSLHGDDLDAKKGGQESNQSEIDQNTSVKKWSEDEQSQLADVDTDSHCGVSAADQNGFESCGFSPSRDDPPSVLMQGTEDQQSCRGSGNAETGTCWSTPTPHTSSDALDDEKSSVSRDEGEELNGSKFYHGDNEYSCSDDGTDISTTPKSSTKNALDDLSNTDFEQSTGAKSSQVRRSSMVRMRQKYLSSLKEQEAEMVRLRKQEIQARKQAGDWMLDCAMEEVLHRLAPTGKAQVKVLVEAFETIMQHSDSEGSQTHHALQEHDSLENSSVSMHC